MKYYYTLDSSNYIVNWSVGASFNGATELPSTVTVPDDLKACSCNAKCYQLIGGVFTFDSVKAAQCEAECQASDALHCYAEKCYVDQKIGDIDTLLTALNSGSGV